MHAFVDCIDHICTKLEYLPPRVCYPISINRSVKHSEQEEHPIKHLLLYCVLHALLARHALCITQAPSPPVLNSPSTEQSPLRVPSDHGDESVTAAALTHWPSPRLGGGLPPPPAQVVFLTCTQHRSRQQAEFLCAECSTGPSPPVAHAKSTLSPFQANAGCPQPGLFSRSRAISEQTAHRSRKIRAQCEKPSIHVLNSQHFK